LQDILIPGAGWQLVGEGYKATEGPAVNAKGEVFYSDVAAGRTFKVDVDGKVTEFLANTKRGDGQAFGPDGRLYSASGEEQAVVAWDEKGSPAVIGTEKFKGNDVVVRSDGSMYVTNPDRQAPSKVWLIKPDGQSKVVDTGLKFANGVTLSPDQSLLYVADSRTHWVYSYQIQPDGSLAHKQRYYWLHVPDNAEDSGADGMEVDAAGRLYVATRLGIQVCDQPGRVNCIIPTPNGKVSNVVIGGPQFDTLYATCGDKVFSRKLKVKAAPSFLAPVKPEKPRL
jgi:sugar lactone lactonase YvrE